MSELFVTSDIEGILTGPVGNPEVFARIEAARIPGKAFYGFQNQEHKRIMESVIAPEIEALDIGSAEEQRWSVTSSIIHPGRWNTDPGAHTDNEQEDAAPENPCIARALFNTLPLEVIFIEILGYGKTSLDSDLRHFPQLYSYLEQQKQAQQPALASELKAFGADIAHLEPGRWHGIREDAWHQGPVNHTDQPVDRTLIYTR